MEIYIEKIQPEGLSLNFVNSVANFPVLTEMVSAGECKFPVPIKTALRAQRISDMVEIEGNIETLVGLPCSRCLQIFETPLKSHFSLTYIQRAGDIEADGEPQEVELSAEDMGIVYFQGEKINLQDTIQEQVLIELPLRILCKPGCKGLCPRCGVDLNDDPCDCDRRSSPGKFDVLKNLKIEK